MTGKESGMAKKVTLGVIVGNRGFFPAWLAEKGRKEILQTLSKAGVRSVCLTPKDTKCGTVETWDDAKKCAELFRKRAEDIDGILITLPNFGDEKAASNAVRLSGLDVPVLVHAFPDDPAKLDRLNRRDSFCGKLSVCNNLKQYGIPYSLTSLHTESPGSDAFARDLDRFVRVCRVVGGVSTARLGAIGARTGPFNTVRYSEKILEANGISTEVLDLSEALGWVAKLPDKDPSVRAKIRRIRDYVAGEPIPEGSLLRMAKLGVVIDRWIKANEIDAMTLQCWTSIVENFGIVPCGIMSMMSESLIPAACEVDAMGALGMYALQLASGTPSSLVDWNNNYGEDPDCCVIFHCSNLPASAFRRMKTSAQVIISETVGAENAYTCTAGVIKEGPITYARLSTDDECGVIRGYVGEGDVLQEEPQTFGGSGALHVRDLQTLLHFMCRHGFEHHVAVNYSTTAEALHEAFTTYLGWDIYHHK